MQGRRQEADGKDSTMADAGFEEAAISAAHFLKTVFKELLQAHEGISGSWRARPLRDANAL